MADESGNAVLSYAPSKDYQSIVISTPDLEQGKTYTLLSGGTSNNQLVGLSDHPRLVIRDVLQQPLLFYEQCRADVEAVHR